MVPNWRWEDQSLDAYDLRVAGWLASHTDAYLASNVSRNEIVRRVGMSRDRVSTCLNNLVARGIIIAHIVDASAAKGRRRYTIEFDWDVWETDPAKDATRPVDPSAKDAGRPIKPAPKDATRPQVGRQASPEVTQGEEQSSETPPQASGGAISLREQATRITKDWWDSITPKPATKYIAVVKVVENALRNEWPEVDIARALRAGGVPSAGGFDLWRARQTEAAKPKPGPAGKPGLWDDKPFPTSRSIWSDKPF